MSSNRNQLIGEIEGRSQLLIGDCLSFIYLRTTKQYKRGDSGLGGGNVLIVMGMFNLLNFLAKIHYMLLYGRKKIKADNSVNEENAFKRLIKSMPGEISFGLHDFIDKDEEDELGKIWNAFRNNPSHMAVPTEPSFAVEVEGLSGYKEKLSWLMSRRSSHVYTFDRANRRGVFVDTLIRDVSMIKDWLCNEITDGRFKDTNIIVANSWITDKEGVIQLYKSNKY